MNIKSPFLNGINQGKITEEQRQHFYKVLHLAEQKWRTSKGFDDPEKMRTLMEKRGMTGVLESINCIIQMFINILCVSYLFDVVIYFIHE